MFFYDADWQIYIRYESFDKIEKGIREINHRITEYGKYVRIYL